MENNKKAFVHLHVHTEYSVLDGFNKVKLLVERIKNLGMQACAITDHGTLSGVIEFYKAMEAEKLKAIIGMEAYVTQDADDQANENKTRDNRHIVLLAMNDVGFRNLVWLNNQAYLHNFYYNPRVWIEHFKTHNEGLIATTACLAGVIAKREVWKEAIVEQSGGFWDKSTESYHDPDGINVKWLNQLKECSPGRLYIEIQDHPNWEQKAYNRWAMQRATEHGLPLVLTCDAHYPRAEDKHVHNLLMAQQFKMTLQEYEAKDQFELLSFIREPEDLYDAAAKIKAEEAFWNTRNIAEQCNFKFQLGKYETPNFDITKCKDYQEFLQWQKQNINS